MELIYGLIVILIVGGLFLTFQYNSLVGLRNHISDAWANIDTELKRRHELIPRLVATVKGYAAHERAVLEKVVELRQRCLEPHRTAADQTQDENQLAASVQRLLAVVENYPDLKADQHFLRLQKELVNTEDRIQAARRFYNGNVRDYRNRCESFPSNLVANFFGFEQRDYLEMHAAVRQVPDLDMA